jgi:hypothetical protein
MGDTCYSLVAIATGTGNHKSYGMTRAILPVPPLRLMAKAITTEIPGI